MMVKNILDKIEFGHVMSFAILLMLFVLLFIFRGNEQTVNRIVELLCTAFGMIMAFFFTKYNNGQATPPVNNTTIIPPTEINPTGQVELKE